jgi:hypothetical protein
MQEEKKQIDFVFLTKCASTIIYFSDIEISLPKSR